MEDENEFSGEHADERHGLAHQNTIGSKFGFDCIGKVLYGTQRGFEREELGTGRHDNRPLRS